MKKFKSEIQELGLFLSSVLISKLTCKIKNILFFPLEGSWSSFLFASSPLYCAFMFPSMALPSKYAFIAAPISASVSLSNASFFAFCTCQIHPSLPFVMSPMFPSLPHSSSSVPLSLNLHLPYTYPAVPPS